MQALQAILVQNFCLEGRLKHRRSPGAYTQKLLHPGAVSTAVAAPGGKSHRTPRGPSPPATAKAAGAAAGRMGSVAQCEGASVLSGSEAARTQVRSPCMA